MVNNNTIVGSFLKILNDSSKIPDPRPSTTRYGSLFFGPNQELSFRNNVPKGKVHGGPTASNNYSFGRSFERDKEFNIHVMFYTTPGYKDVSTGYQDYELIHDYFEKIEQAIIDYGSEIGPVAFGDMVMEDDGPVRFEDVQVYGASYLFPVKVRR